MGRRELVMMERMFSKRAGYTAYVKAGSLEVTLHGLQYRRTDRTTAAGIPVFQRLIDPTKAVVTTPAAHAALRDAMPKEGPTDAP